MSALVERCDDFPTGATWWTVSCRECNVTVDCASGSTASDLAKAHDHLMHTSGGCPSESMLWLPLHDELFRVGPNRSIPGSARIEKEVCEESEAGYCWVLVCPACDLESCHYTVWHHESEVLGLLEVARHNRFNHPPQGTEPPEVTA